MFCFLIYLEQHYNDYSTFKMTMKIQTINEKAKKSIDIAMTKAIEDQRMIPVYFLTFYVDYKHQEKNVRKIKL